MSLIPSKTVYEVVRDDTGVVVWAMQKALNATVAKAENKIAVDSEFGLATEEAVVRFQEKKGLAPDGSFGPQTSEAMAITLAARATTPVPDGLIRGLIAGESGYLIGSVNHSVPGGVDCGYCQRRVFDEDADNLDVVRRAFDPMYQINLFAGRLRNRYEIFRGRGFSAEKAWRLATLNHNYPYAAEQLSLGRWPNAYSDSYQQWVVNIGGPNGPLTFPDGEPITTPMEWCQFYALGAPEHDWPGQMTKFVTSWGS